jgi:hypothetical protein
MFSLKLYMLPNLLSHIIGCDTATLEMRMVERARTRVKVRMEVKWVTSIYLVEINK